MRPCLSSLFSLLSGTGHRAPGTDTGHQTNLGRCKPCQFSSVVHAEDRRHGPHRRPHAIYGIIILYRVKRGTSNTPALAYHVKCDTFSTPALAYHVKCGTSTTPVLAYHAKCDTSNTPDLAYLVKCDTSNTPALTYHAQVGPQRLLFQGFPETCNFKVFVGGPVGSPPRGFKKWSK